MALARVVDLNALVGFSAECTVWGAYCVLFLLSLSLLFRHGKERDISVIVLVLHCLLFGVCTAHFALEYDHYVGHLRTMGTNGFANETHKLLGADILISIADLLGDALLIYRCWILWNRNYLVVALPTLSAVAGFGCLMQVAHFVHTETPESPAPPSALVPLTTAGYSLPLCTNVMATLLLVLKMWWMTRPALLTLRSTTRLANRAMAIVVESGLIYLAVQLVLVVLIATKNPAEIIVGHIAVHVYGIAPTLMIIRVALGISTGSIAKDTIHLSNIVWAPQTAQTTTGTRHETVHVRSRTSSEAIAPEAGDALERGVVILSKY